MPHYNIHLRIVCGETTCAVVADRFCEYFERPLFSNEAGECRIFGELDWESGWAARHPACIAASTPAEKPKGSA